LAPLLSRKFQNNFSAEVQSAGDKLLAAGKVNVYEGGVDRAGVEVEADFFADVRFAVSAGVLHIVCDCEQALAGNSCLHMWAALLAVEQAGDLAMAGKRSVAKQPQFPGQNPVTPAAASKSVAPQPVSSPAPPPHRQFEVAAPRQTAVAANTAPDFDSAADCEINYIIDVQASRACDHDQWMLAVYWRQRRGGTWGRRRELLPQSLRQLPMWADMHVFELLQPHWQRPERAAAAANYFALPPTTLLQLLPELARSQRLYWRHNADDQQCMAVEWDDHGQWQLQLQFTLEGKQQIRATASFVRQQQSQDMEAPLLLCPGGLLLSWQHLASYADANAYSLLQRFRHHSTWCMSLAQADEMVRHILTATDLQLSELPPELCYTPASESPQPQLFVRTARYKYRGREQLHAELNFRYGSVRVAAAEAPAPIVDARTHRLYQRDLAFEQQCRELLLSLGFRHNNNAAREELGWKLLPAELDASVRALLEHNWMLVAEGKTYRKPEDKQASLHQKGQDWFELQGSVSFGDEQVPLPELLKALKNGSSCVLLGDGSFGMLPLEWLSRYTLLTEIGEISADGIVFRRGQATLLAALLRDRPEIDVDAGFAAIRDRLADFRHLEQLLPAAGFQGRLRDYQQVGLAWMVGLRCLGLGGCLADDMGLGKTVQVLALLQHLYAQGERQSSLIVLPKSLISNWMTEAARFTPQLRLLVHAGSNRDTNPEALRQANLVLITYGTLRQDAALLAQIRFACCILDESQAIKNVDTSISKAVRLIVADTRLAMTGTPIENHLGELFSQFEFLNPGMLGRVGALSRYSLSQRELPPEQVEELARALRPLILRRTKAQVAKELPAKTEQVLYCELYPEQRQIYDQLRQYYRQQLLAQRQKADSGNKIQVLEALLRLRQAACHSGLINARQQFSRCAKLDLLLENIVTLVDEQHKVLVFSQFTAFLALARQRLEQAGIAYAYLDGQTVDRQGAVARFQTDPTVPVFLISIKAGGVGLNLTAADYVMLLDPWWNPAVEAQAIDRAYRIGQNRQVFAYRLIATDTVEERVLAMQQGKRDLADSVIRADALNLSKLTTDDLNYLLS